jgi:hypothetical protein
LSRAKYKFLFAGFPHLQFRQIYRNLPLDTLVFYCYNSKKSRKAGDLLERTKIKIPENSADSACSQHRDEHCGLLSAFL